MTGACWLPIAVGVVASVQDLRRRTVPNWLTLGGGAAGLAYGAAAGWHGLGNALAGGVAGLLLLLPFYLAGAMGGGDVKLMAAFGTMLGPKVAGAVVFGAAAGGVWALAAALCGRRTIPYAPALAVGVWISLAGGS